MRTSARGICDARGAAQLPTRRVAGATRGCSLRASVPGAAPCKTFRCDAIAGAAGFTLVEILIVIVIIAIGAAVAVATIERDERGVAAREARRFAGALEYAATRAQARAETLGVSAEGRVVRFWRRDDETGRWSPVGDD